jgi:hypothetical protein
MNAIVFKKGKKRFGFPKKCGKGLERGDTVLWALATVTPEDCKSPN